MREIALLSYAATVIVAALVANVLAYELGLAGLYCRFWGFW